MLSEDKVLQRIEQYINYSLKIAINDMHISTFLIKINETDEFKDFYKESYQCFLVHFLFYKLLKNDKKFTTDIPFPKFFYNFTRRPT